MTGEQGARAQPPAEVPREFADAYREAYEAALAAQAELKPGTHAERGVERRWRAPVETVVSPTSSGTGEETVYERVRDSVWFVPSLLVLLLGLMLVGAYVLGRVFAAHVGA